MAMLFLLMYLTTFSVIVHLHSSLFKVEFLNVSLLLYVTKLVHKLYIDIIVVTNCDVSFDENKFSLVVCAISFMLY